MNLLIYSYFPVRESHQAGGAQFLLRELILGFLASDIKVKVICPELDNLEQGDILKARNLEVLPVLKESKPDKELDLFERFHNIKKTTEAVQQADVIWSIDRSFPVRVSQPIVMTFDTIAYGIEMESFLNFNWDVLVVPSRYVLDVTSTFTEPQYWVEGTPPKITLIPNGISTKAFVKTDPTELCSSLGLSRFENYLLFPHRPDSSKGFKLALRVLKELLNRDQPYKLLIPTAPLSIKSELEIDARFYDDLQKMVNHMDLASHVIFHRWISFNELPAYFSLGKWSLALGTIPEGFGFTPVQAISCGTPVISTKAGALRQLFPPSHGVQYVDFDDVNQIVESILAHPAESEIVRGQKHVKEYYSIERCVENYISCFKYATKNHNQFYPICGSPIYRISPWCHLGKSNRIWNDFQMKECVLNDREYNVLLMINWGKFSEEVAKQYHTEIDNLVNQGLII